MRKMSTVSRDNVGIGVLLLTGVQDPKTEDANGQLFCRETLLNSVTETELEIWGATNQVRDAQTKREFTKEDLELAKRVNDEHIYSLLVAPGMLDQIYRHGYLPKKTLDSDGYIRMHGSKNYYRDSRSNTPNGSIIIHEDDVDPVVRSCKTFIHPPYGSEVEYRGEKGRDYAVRLTLAQLAAGANDCGFCSILYQGIQSQRGFWILEWAKHSWMDTRTYEDLVSAGSDMPWILEFADEVVHGKEIEKNEVFLYISFPKGRPYVGVLLMLKPHPLVRNELRRPLADVEFYTTPGFPSKWAAFGPAPHIHPEMITDNSIDQLSLWIDDCKTNHQVCNVRKNFGLPSRLLSVVGMEDNSIPIIRLGDTDPKQEYEYAALSHVWSLTTPLKTSLENLHKHRQAIPWNDLSVGLRETIILTMRLGITHLWIDSLCIIQDSTQDWELESPRMGLIYSAATVVLAAHGRQLGFQKAPIVDLRDPDPSRRYDDNPVHARLKIDHKYIFSTSTDTKSWFGRGWCMQERFFAPRVLHFGGYYEEVWFECNTHTRCECSHITDGRREDKIYTLKSRLTSALAEVINSPDDTEVLDELWRAYILACEDYTSRGLTYGLDTLPAISSLMSQFFPFFGSYYAGLWERHLILSLQWESLDTRRCHRHMEYVAPSWSWASRSGAAVWYLDCTALTTPVPTSVTHEFATVVGVSCSPDGANPFGKVSEGQMTLRGYVMEMEIASTEQLVPDGRMEMKREGMNEKNQECYVMFDAIEDAEKTKKGEILICLDILRDKQGLHGNFVSGLVLRLVDANGAVYKRVGFSTMKAEQFDGSKMAEVTII